MGMFCKSINDNDYERYFADRRSILYHISRVTETEIWRCFPDGITMSELDDFVGYIKKDMMNRPISKYGVSDFLENNPELIERQDELVKELFFGSKEKE